MKPGKSKPPVPVAFRLLQLGFSTLGPLFPGLFAGLAYRIWFTPQRFHPPEHESRAISLASRSTLDVNGRPIQIYQWGEGPLILFIHGWSGRGSQASHFVNKLTDKGYAVLSFDAPAHGKTPGKQSNILEISDVVNALHRQYGDFHAAITHSFGGMILPYAMKLGVRAGRCACICPAADLDTLLKNFQRQLSIPDSIIQRMRDRLRTRFGDEMGKIISTIENVSTLAIPGLVIHDEDDSEIPWQSGKQVADAWPGAKFMLTHKLGHRRILRDPETVQAVVDFVAQG